MKYNSEAESYKLFHRLIRERWEVDDIKHHKIDHGAYADSECFWCVELLLGNIVYGFNFFDSKKAELMKLRFDDPTGKVTTVPLRLDNVYSTAVRLIKDHLKKKHA